MISLVDWISNLGLLFKAMARRVFDFYTFLIYLRCTLTKHTKTNETEQKWLDELNSTIVNLFHSRIQEKNI